MSPIPDFVVELRRHVGQALLWMPGVTAVVARETPSGTELLLIRRSDTGEWAPITGIVDPGEEPAVAARREAAEEASVQIEVQRLASVSTTEEITHVNGDRAVYLDLTFRCAHVDGVPAAGDDEVLEARWWPAAALPPMKPAFLTRIAHALDDQERTRFRT